MATTKKSTVKKTTVKAKLATKAAVKSTHKPARAVQVKKAAPMRSFKVFRSEGPFFTTHITRQTVYWSILLIYIMIMQVWILNIQLDIIQVTDSITSQIQKG